MSKQIDSPMKTNEISHYINRSNGIQTVDRIKTQINKILKNERQRLINMSSQKLQDETEKDKKIKQLINKIVIIQEKFLKQKREKQHIMNNKLKEYVDRLKKQRNQNQQLHLKIKQLENKLRYCKCQKQNRIYQQQHNRQQISQTHAKNKQENQKSLKEQNKLLKVKLLQELHKQKTIQLETHCKQLQTLNSQILSTNDSLNTKLKKCQEQIKIISLNSLNLQKTLKDKQNQISLISKQNTIILQQKQTFQKLKIDFERQNAQKTNQIKLVIQQNQIKILKLENLLAQKQSYIIEMEKKTQKFRLEIEQVKTILKKQIDEKQNLQRLFKQSKNTIQKIMIQNKLLEDQLKFDKLDTLFNQDILFFQKTQKKFIIKTLETQMKKKIIKTRKLYSFDFYKNNQKENLINTHRFIDGFPNLFTLIRTQNGKCIGAFSEDKFQQGKIATQKSIIMSLNSNQGLSKYYLNTPGSVPIIYNNQAIIYGNYDLQFKNYSSEISMNIGQIKSSYDTKLKNAQQFLGLGNEKNAVIDIYEIYSIEFQK